jgi:hypothetical protein
MSALFRLFDLFDFDLDLVVDKLHGVSHDAGFGGWTEVLAAGEIEAGGMPGAHHLTLLAHAFGERSATMRANSRHGEDLARIVKHGDRHAVEQDLFSLARRDFGKSGNCHIGHRAILTEVLNLLCGSHGATATKAANIAWLTAFKRAGIGDHLAGGGGSTWGAVDPPAPPTLAPPSPDIGPRAGVANLSFGGVDPLPAPVSQPVNVSENDAKAAQRVRTIFRFMKFLK